MTAQRSLQNPDIPSKIRLNISDDKMIDADIQSIPLQYLKLDPQNVRFKHIPEPMTDEQIDDYLWKQPDTKSTFREIKFSQGLSEKPYVKKISDTEFRVIEGNRRTVCLRHLAGEIASRKEKNIPLEKIDPVQCVVLPNDVDDSAIALFLARIHVSGKKDWPAMDKGAHVYDLIKKHDYDWDEVAKAISIGKNTISQNVKAYDTTLEYHKKYPDDESWLQRFSHFLELYKRRTLKDWSDNPTNLSKFMEWVNNGQIPMAIQVRKLDKIVLENKTAYEALQNGSTLLEAEELAKNSDKKDLVNPVSENVNEKVSELFDMVHNFPRGKMNEVAKDKDQLNNLENLHKEFGKLLKDIKKIGGH